MGTRADFYLGRGKRAAWIGSQAFDGNDTSMPDEILQATISESFAFQVARHLKDLSHATFPEQGYPWPWETSKTTDYTYAFDKGTVWITCFGEGWHSAKSFYRWKKDCDEWRKERKKWDEFMEQLRIPSHLRETKVNRPKEPAEEPPECIIDGGMCVWPDMSESQNVTTGKRSGMIFVTAGKVTGDEP